MRNEKKMTGKQVTICNNITVAGFIVMAIAMIVLCGWVLAIDPTWTGTVLVGTILGGLFSAILAWWMVANYA